MTNESSKSLKSIAAFAGSGPSEVWLRTGQFISGASVLSLLSIGIAGLEMGETAQYTPYITLFFGFFALYYAGRLANNVRIAERLHELEMADKRNDSEPQS